MNFACRRPGWGRAVGVVAVAVAVLAGSGEAVAAPGTGSDSGSAGSSDSGSLGGSSDLGSSDSGSVTSGSTMPESWRDDPGPIPPLRDDIVTPAIVSEKFASERVARFLIASPALRREVGVDVLLAADSSRPTLYMLEGVGAGEDQSAWMYMTDAPKFFADKNINVVLTNGGVASLYTDWDESDPKVGLHKWETFLTKELPPLINARLKTNGVNAIAGTSMGAQGAMMLAHRRPDLYRGIAVFSGCYSTTDDVGRLSTQVTVSSRGGDPAKMWGVPGGPEWGAHDTVRNAEALRGKPIYLSVGTGIVGEHEGPGTDAERIFVGGGIEAAANQCTRRLDKKLRELGIPATVDYEVTGVHAWAYWNDRLPKAWPTLRQALGL
ncbi:alpha/beta hydrolase [Rhodococcus maanshanensis]|uniref:S-formylglutathione hydrolase FrmB n=1 Tax=Rhodococcus maanshanensis TaxID=183556 RepID=A0A1H7JKK7_9NOCA|nr:alpha/beta hydrolase family protein [Rhodococcus maanshanensis]SEK75208.1 S-formylglutathione hydrolase FrmB [Rhodococcus maanshanensis]